jgi:HSP20 family protein
MSTFDLIPWRRETELPFSFSREMNRMFEDFFGAKKRFPFALEDYAAFVPVDVLETEDTMEISAELPGLSDKDIDVMLSPDRNYLTIKGEKRFEKEKKEKGFYHSERAYGAFRRTIALPFPAKDEMVKATFDRGVLTIFLSKDRVAVGERHIKVTSA